MKRLRSSLAGEFVMIVLGVLVALAADSALERRRLRDKAHEALRALREDIRGDVRDLESYWEPSLTRQEDARTRLSAFLRNGDRITDSLRFVQDVRETASYTTFDPRTSAIEELKSTGGLGLIEDDALRSGILDYQNAVENIAEFDVLHRALFLELYADLATKVVEGLALPESFVAEVPGADSGAELAAREAAAVALDARAIRSSGDLSRLLAATGQPFAIKADRYRNLRGEGIRLLAMLDAILGGG